MTDDELIKRARSAYDKITFDCPVESLLEAAPALFRALDERDALRKKYEPCMAEPTLCSRGTCYVCVVQRLEGARKENDTLRGLLGNSTDDGD